MNKIYKKERGVCRLFVPENKYEKYFYHSVQHSIQNTIMNSGIWILEKLNGFLIFDTRANTASVDKILYRLDLLNTIKRENLLIFRLKSFKVA